MAGAVIAAYNARLALLINAATFLTSAIILRYGIRDRPPAMRTEYRSRLLREAGDGFRIVFGTPALRAIAVLVFASMLFSIVPEGLAIGWASQLVDEERQRGLYQGLIMVANPVGYLLGGLLTARLVPPAQRRRLIRVFAVIAPLALVPAVTNPAVGGVIAMTVICGFAVAGMMPATNALFVQALPNGFRARAFGVMQSGVQVTQGIAVLATGLLAGAFPLPVVVGLWSLAGVGLMLVVASRWPRQEVFTAAIENAEQANAAELKYEPRHARPSAPRPGPLPPAHNPAGV
jgi:MFS family permease